MRRDDLEWVRAYLYRVALVVQPVLGVIGVAKDSTVWVVLSIVTAVLSVGMATLNTSTVRHDEGADRGSISLQDVFLVLAIIVCALLILRWI